MNTPNEPKPARSLEERLKFDSGLAIGCHLVRLTRAGRAIDALCEIHPRGAVYLLVKPDDGDMYSSWRRVRGDTLKNNGATIVWGARDPDTMRMFDCELAATLEV